MDSGHHQEVEKDWDWSLCEYDIKKVTDQTETIWNLKSSIQLSIPNENVHHKLDLFREHPLNP